MKRILSAIAFVGTLAACAPQAGTSAQAATKAGPEDCAKPESGIIRPETPGLAEVRLEGPFKLLSLQAMVDPANPHGGVWFWSRENASMTLQDFKGPFYLAKGETIFGRGQFGPMGIVYSGCRLE